MENTIDVRLKCIDRINKYYGFKRYAKANERIYQYYLLNKKGHVTKELKISDMDQLISLELEYMSEEEEVENFTELIKQLSVMADKVNAYHKKFKYAIHTGEGKGLFKELNENGKTIQEYPYSIFKHILERELEQIEAKKENDINSILSKSLDDLNEVSNLLVNHAKNDYDIMLSKFLEIKAITKILNYHLENLEFHSKGKHIQTINRIKSFLDTWKSFGDEYYG